MGFGYGQDNVIDDDDEPKVKKPWSCNSATFLRFMFSEGGLTLVIILYMIGGGLLFRAIEAGGEEDAFNATLQKALEIEAIKLDLIAYFIEKGEQWKDQNYSMVIAEFESVLLNQYQLVVADAIQNYSYDGTVHDRDVHNFGWSFFSAWLFAATILTTVGYGSVCPVTEVGRLVTLLYAVIAVPLMSIFLLKIGHCISKFIRLTYTHICCYPCRRQREKAHGRWLPQMKKTQLLAEDGSGLAEDKEEEGSIPNMLSLFIVFMYLMFGTVMFYIWEQRDNWNMVSSLYWGVVTLMTIGFGDMVPGQSNSETTDGRLMLFVLIVYMVIGLTLVATFIDLAVKKAARAAIEKLVEKNEDEGEEQSMRSNSTMDTEVPKSISSSQAPISNKRRQLARPKSTVSAADLDTHLEDVTPPPIVLA